MATTFGTSAGDVIRPWGKSEIRHYPEAASQTFKRGEPVILGAAGVENRIRVASDDPVGSIVGVAAEDASGVTGTKIGVYLAKPELKFLIKTLAAAAIDFTALGSCVAIEKHATLAIWVADVADAGHDAIVLEEFLNPITMQVQTTEGDFEVYAIVHFDPKATVFGAGT